MIDSAGAQIDAWWARIDELELSSAVQLLDRTELSRAERVRSVRARERFIKGRAHLRSVLATYLDCEPQDVSLDTSCSLCRHPSHGKPRVQGADIDFSLTRGGDATAVAVSRRHVVGIDIEPFDAAASLEECKHLVLQAGERDYLARTSTPERARALVSMWTLKEAFLKARGVGLSVDPVAVATRYTRSGILTLGENLLNSGWRSDTSTRGGHVVSVVGHGDPWSLVWQSRTDAGRRLEGA